MIKKLAILAVLTVFGVWLGGQFQKPEPNWWSNLWHSKPRVSSKFWEGHPIWLDDETLRRVRQTGYQYPPMPYEDPYLPKYPNDEGIHGGGLEGDQPRIFSSLESAFWNHFSKTHPLPPEVIERMQQNAASDYFFQPHDNSYSEEDIRTMRNHARDEPMKMNYPPEPFTEEALFWSYANNYRPGIRRGMSLDEAIASLSDKALSVNLKQLTNSPSEQQFHSMNAWKISYLKRLRKENADEMYIKAYLKTWKLTEEQVFGSEKQSLPAK